MNHPRVRAWLVLLVGGALMGAAPAGPPSSALDIVPAQSSARFVVHLRSRTAVQGTLPRVSGQFTGSVGRGWQVLVKIDGRSLVFEGPRWMDRITRSENFLALDRHPDLGFDSDAFSDAALRTGGPLSGKLTLRGLTRPVSFRLLPSACTRPGRDCDIEVEGTISRHAFGMNAYRAVVRDNVDFQIRVRLRADDAAQ